MGRGYNGRVLWADLTKHSFTDEQIDDSIYEKFLGGYGLAAKLIFDRQTPGLSRFDENNILAVMSGLLTNGRAVFNGRWMLAGKSPLTGGWGDSNCGGDFAPGIKATGYDGIFLIGKSESPVYLLIDGDKKQFMDASHLWGKMDTRETEDYLREEHGMDSRVACIGAGGENLSLISGVVNDQGRIAGRSGLGALMGSKNLKAICLRGDKEVGVCNEDEVWKHTREFLDEMDSNMNEFGHGLRQFGTAHTVAGSAASGDSPIKNWLGVAEIDFPSERAERISKYSVTKYEVRKYHCYGCPLGCGGMCHIPGDPLLRETHRPEYETICGFGTLLLSDDLHSIFTVNELLNRAGIDTISCATTLSWAFEAYERGLLTNEDTDGLELRWGNGKAVVELARKMISGEGIGVYLRDGVKAASEHFGPEAAAIAMHVAGQELPMHDCRLPGPGGLDLGVGYEVEPTPGRHTSTFPGWDQYKEPSLYLRLVKRYAEDTTPDELGERLKGSSCAMDVLNGLGFCYFGFYLGPTPPLVEWANATTGWEKDFNDYLEIGRRIKTVRHSFNIREGIDTAKIKMPDRARGIPQRWDDAKEHYYRAMGWDPETSKPLSTTLDELDLPEVKNALYPG